MTVEHGALLGFALDQGALQALALGHIMDEGVQQRPPAPGHRPQMHFDIAHFAIGQPVAELFMAALIGRGQGEIVADLFGRRFVDVLQAHAPQAPRFITIEGASRGVGIDDRSGRRVDEQHGHPCPREHGALAAVDPVAFAFGPLTFALLVGEHQARDRQQDGRANRQGDGEHAVLAPLRERIVVGHPDHHIEGRRLDHPKRVTADHRAHRRRLAHHAFGLAALHPIDHRRTRRPVHLLRRRRMAHDQTAVIDTSDRDQTLAAQIERFEQAPELRQFDGRHGHAQQLSGRTVNAQGGQHHAFTAAAAAGHFRIGDGRTRPSAGIEEFSAGPDRRQGILAA